jgi:hypothetical protein
MFFYKNSELHSLVCYLKLAWNLVHQIRLGHFGLGLVDKKDSKSEKSIQTKDHPMVRLLLVDLFVQKRVVDHKIKWII